MEVKRLSWAGVRVTVGSRTAVVDALGDASPLAQFMGTPTNPLVSVGDPGSIDAALVTHEHPDHWDPATLTECLVDGAPVVCPPGMAAAVEAKGLRPVALPPGEVTEAAGLTVEAVPAVGGLGEEQVSYIVLAGGRKILHCGDTLWHGYWWAIAEKGPFDIAFLPINGALVHYPSPTGIPAALTPEQAAAAALILKPTTVSPIHYGLFHFPPSYSEYPNAEQEFVREAKQRGITVQLARDGETLLSTARGRGG